MYSKFKSGSINHPRSYSFKIVASILEDEELKFSPFHGKYDCGFHVTGCHVSFENSDVIMSVQTNSAIAGPAFCETAILNSNNGIIYIPSLGYSDCIRHEEPEDFKIHIRRLKSLLTGKNSSSFKDRKMSLSECCSYTDDDSNTFLSFIRKMTGTIPSVDTPSVDTPSVDTPSVDTPSS